MDAAFWDGFEKSAASDDDKPYFSSDELKRKRRNVSAVMAVPGGIMGALTASKPGKGALLRGLAGAAGTAAATYGSMAYAHKNHPYTKGHHREDQKIIADAKAGKYG